MDSRQQEGGEGKEGGRTKNAKFSMSVSIYHA
jgi:hypothetical protein